MTRLNGILGLFDTEGSAYISSIWQALSERNIPVCSREYKGCVPHVTFAVYHECNLKIVEERTRHFAGGHRSVPLELSHLGFFKHEHLTSFLGVTPEVLLLDFHRMLHDTLALCSGSASPLYFPGSWVPHCTLSNEVNVSDTQNIIEVLSQVSLPRRLQVTSLSVTTVDTETREWEYRNDITLLP